jgi:rhodanese-related sulfurtransferase
VSRIAGRERIVMHALASRSVQSLEAAVRGPFPPTIIDVRRRDAFERDPVRIPLALRHPPGDLHVWAPTLERWRPVVVYCVHGHQVSRDAAEALRSQGFDAHPLEGGLEGWREAGGAIEPWRPPSRWVTRERPKIDRIACPWFVRRFVDASAEILYVPSASVRAVAREQNAIPFDVPDVEYTHAGELCSFDAFVARHAPDDGALGALADIVRAADTDTLERSPQASGLLALSLGLGSGLADDAALLHHGLLVYDALYAWCRSAASSQTNGIQRR